MLANPPWILALVVLGAALLACGQDEGRTGTTIPHTDGVSVEVSDSDQPFDYLISVIGLAANGTDVPAALEEIGYERNRRLWDVGFADTIEDPQSNDVSLIGLASAASAQASSRGAFLSAFQEHALLAYVDSVLDGKVTLPLVKDPEKGSEAGRPSITSAAMLRWIVESIQHREQQTHRFLEQSADHFVEPLVACTPAAWLAEQGGVVVEQIRATLRLQCGPGSIHSAWQAVVHDLEESDFKPAFGSRHVDLLAIAMVVSDGLPELFTSADRARVQAIIDKAVPLLSDDAYDWLYFYRLFTWHPATKYHVEITEAASAVMVHTASHGAVPELEIHR